MAPVEELLSITIRLTLSEANEFLNRCLVHAHPENTKMMLKKKDTRQLAEL
jgi:hypothetical protein